MAIRLQLLPVLASASNRCFVASIEHENAAFKAFDGTRPSAVHEKQDMRPIWIFLIDGQKNRLHLCRPVVARAMRQEAVVTVGPEKIIDGIEPFRPA